MRNSENKVTVQVLGSTARVVGLDEVATVGEAKELMGVPNYTATVNGEPAEDDDMLEDYSFVSLAPSVKGGNL